MDDPVKTLLEKLGEYGITVSNPEGIELLRTALVHTSYANELRQSGKNVESNERLEFLGDAVLNLVISEHLFKNSNLAEGEMAAVKGVVVSGNTLAEVASRINLGMLMYLGKGEEKSGGRSRKSILADALESVIAAVYLSTDFESTKRFIWKLFEDALENALRESPVHDYKTALQELTQSRWKVLPVYKVVSGEGPPHARIFEVVVEVNGDRIARARGRSKKEAERRAAEIAYKILVKEERKSADNTR